MSSLSDDFDEEHHNDDDDDPIVQEIPIFLSQKASESIRLLQYPIRTANRSLEQDEHDLGQVRDVQYDVEQDKLSLKYYLNTDSDRYINETGDSEIMHMSFTSKSVKQASNYCVGIIRNHQLFINPIRSIYQMRPDFSHKNPNMVENKNDDETNTMNDNANIVNCQIIHDRDNDNLYYDAHHSHQTREFIHNKREFIEKLDQTQETFIDKFKNKHVQNRTTNAQQYNHLSEIPCEIPRSDALKLPLHQSVAHYLRQCTVLTPAHLFFQLNCDHAERQRNAIKTALRYSWLVNGRFIVKHKYLRSTLLTYYKDEWNIFIQLFYRHKSRIKKEQFFKRVGETNVAYEVVDKMLDLLADHRRDKHDRNVWWLKHDNLNEDMLRTQFDDLNDLAIDALEKMCAANGENVVDDDGDLKMKKKQNIKDKEEVDEEEDDDLQRDTAKYIACKKFVIQKLNKNKVLLRKAIVKLIAKYGKRSVVLQNMPPDVVDLVLADVCWKIGEDKYGLKEVNELQYKTQYNQHRKRIIDWFNKHAKKIQIKESTARRQWKGLNRANQEICKIIMSCICDWDDDESVWRLKSGIPIKKK